MSHSSASLTSLNPYPAQKTGAISHHHLPLTRPITWVYSLHPIRPPTPVTKLIRHLIRVEPQHHITCTFWMVACCNKSQPPSTDDAETAILQNTKTHTTIARLRAVEMSQEPGIELYGVAEELADDAGEAHFLLIPIPWITLPWYSRLLRRALFTPLLTFPKTPATGLTPTHCPTDHCEHVRRILRVRGADLSVIRPNLTLRPE
ncbi:hypothetical protein BV25DRAFT_1914467 [Artomyces pyxidatus]|uniref:Uncharacterized protein n=1 Tax=Artomyces pyxidatus TaxID=48021 RepID=A0ACB8T7W4_9AGAM|nr:hypothetical protein BV25DRAFT_1914467 [Artomyces pyxidatus]